MSQVDDISCEDTITKEQKNSPLRNSNLRNKWLNKANQKSFVSTINSPLRQLMLTCDTQIKNQLIERPSIEESATISRRRITCIRAIDSREATTMKLRTNTMRQVAYLIGIAVLVLAVVNGAGANYQSRQQDTSAEANPFGAYGNQQQASGAHSPKAKKIQIVYIKVPMAKLRPSLANGNDHSSHPADNSTLDGYSKDGSTTTKQIGSQQQLEASAADQQVQLNDDSSPAAKSLTSNANSQQQSSFLIPMAVVQSGDSSDNSVAGSLQTSAHLQPEHLVAFGHQNSRRQQQLRSPAQMHLSAAMSASQPLTWPSPSVHHNINHGFMSSFLLAEKDKMTAAANRVVNSHQRQPITNPATDTVTPMSQTSTTPQPVAQLVNGHRQGPGGLMPNSMVPFSHMPDNMIGQAYNAAVGQALPAESGLTTGLLGSPSTAHNSNNYNSNSQAKRELMTNNNNGYGGNNGIRGDSSSSHLAASSGSYGATGQNQQDSSSSETAYHHSGSGFGGLGASSGYGNGINTSGASAAFSDYPTGQSTESGPQVYAAQSQANNNYNHHQSGPSHESHNGNTGSSNYLGGQKLRQAKKTIIPIVVQVEHAILENNANAAAMAANYNHKQAARLQGNKYNAHRQPNHGAKGQGRHGKQNGHKGSPYEAASNEMGMNLEMGASGAQYINAANAQDINKITAAINAENAQAAAAALAQADAAFAMSPAGGYRQMQPHNNNHNQQQHRPQSQYAAGLQSAASAILANSHPVIQAAASGGLASVSKLGAKLGEMIALPSMQVPNSISSIGGSLPSALSSLTNQMGMQLNQAVQQVAKEHPNAHAFARQVAQHAGINLANFQPNGIQNFHPQQANQNVMNSNGQHHSMSAAASNQHSSQQSIALSPQAQLQNLKLTIGQNIQSAAAQLIGGKSPIQALQGNPLAQASAASLLSNPMALQSAIKQLGGLSSIASPSIGFAPNSMMSLMQNMAEQAQPSSLVASLMQPSGAQQQVHSGPAGESNEQHGILSSAASETKASGILKAASASQLNAPAPSSFKSKFLSFFQPPKFISNLLSWNDRADERSDSGSTTDLVTPTNSTKTAELEAKTAPVVNATSAIAKNESAIEVNSKSTQVPSSSTTVAPTTAAIKKKE